MVDQEAIAPSNPLTPAQQAWYEDRAVKRDYQIEMLEAMRDTAREKLDRLSLEIAAHLRERELDAAHVMIIDLQSQLAAGRDIWVSSYERLKALHDDLLAESMRAATAHVKELDRLSRRITELERERDTLASHLKDGDDSPSDGSPELPGMDTSAMTTDERDELEAERDDALAALGAKRELAAAYASSLERLAAERARRLAARLKGYDDIPPEDNDGGTPPEWDTSKMTCDEKATAVKLYAEQYSAAYSTRGIAAALHMSPSNYYKLANGKQYHKKAAANQVRPATARKRRPTPDAGINYAVNFASTGGAIIPA